LDIGRETLGLYILDKDLLKGVQFEDFFVGNFPMCKSFFVSSKHQEVLCNQASKGLSFEIWHKRFGHIPLKRKKLVLIIFDASNISNDMPCDICPKARQQRLHF